MEFIDTEKGFKVFKNALSESDIEFGRSAFTSGNELDYQKMTLFVENCLKKISPNFACVKYRASNNTNSSDAGLLHRDIMNYGERWDVPVFTLLSYLDAATMRIIAGSYKKPRMSLKESVEYRWSKLEHITINPGDLFIFHSSSIHSGLFDAVKNKNRRLVQMFEVYPSREMMELYNEKYTLHIQCDGAKCTKSQIGAVSNRVSKIGGLKFINELLYFNAAWGYGKKNPVADQGYTIISSEANAQRYRPETNDRKDNLYYLFTKTNNVENDERWDYIRSEVFLRNYIIILFTFFLVIFLIAKKIY